MLSWESLDADRRGKASVGYLLSTGLRMLASVSAPGAKTPLNDRVSEGVRLRTRRGVPSELRDEDRSRSVVEVRRRPSPWPRMLAFVSSCGVNASVGHDARDTRLSGPCQPPLPPPRRSLPRGACVPEREPRIAVEPMYLRPPIAIRDMLRLPFRRCRLPLERCLGDKESTSRRPMRDSAPLSWIPRALGSWTRRWTGRVSRGVYKSLSPSSSSSLR